MMSTQNPWDLLRSGPDELGPGPRSWAKTEGRLRRAYLGSGELHRPVTPRRRRPSRRSLLACAGLVAAGVAVAVLVPATLPGDSPGGPPSAAAVAVLKDAAQAARSHPSGEPLGAGEYLYLEIDHGSAAGSIHPLGGASRAAVSGGPGDTQFSTFVKQLWIAADGSGRQLVRTAGPQSRTFDSREPAGTFTDAVVYTGDLPLDPSALESAIVQRFEGGHRNDGATFQFAGTFLQADATPQLRAALYRVIATLSGVESLGPMIDTLGRNGVGVGIGVAGGRHLQLIFDPETSAVLQMQETGPDGRLVLYDTYVRSGIVNSMTITPPR